MGTVEKSSEQMCAHLSNLEIVVLRLKLKDQKKNRGEQHDLNSEDYNSWITSDTHTRNR